VCDILQPECQSQLFAVMRCMHGDAELGVEQPPVLLLDEAEALAYGTPENMAPSMADMGSADFTAAVRGLELLGLLEPGLVADEMDVESVTLSSALAFYSSDTREIVIIDRGASMADVDADGVLAHEFIHALQDAKHNLVEFDSRTSETDGNLAIASVVEGEATLYQLMLLLAYRGIGFDSRAYRAIFADTPSSAEAAELEAGSPIVTAGSIFPYTYGARYMAETWLQGKALAIDALFQTPPTSSLQVMLGAGADAPQAALFVDAPAAPAGQHLATEDVLGAWVLDSLMAELMGPADRVSLPGLASRWRGDHVWVYAADGDTPLVTVLAAVHWEDSEAATRFAELMRARVVAGGASSVQVKGTTTEIVVTEQLDDVASWATLLDSSLP
jgi:hypothetical protein